VRVYLRFNRLVVGDENGYTGGFTETLVVVVIISII
jgi:hypothetical protein